MKNTVTKRQVKDFCALEGVNTSYSGKTRAMYLTGHKSAECVELIYAAFDGSSIPFSLIIN